MWSSAEWVKKPASWNVGLYMYTEHQKKLMITSLECHPSKKNKVFFNHRGDKCYEIARGQFSKITKTACLSGWEFEADKSRYGIYVTRHWNWMNSYWIFWIGCLRGARSVSSLCDFRKMTFRYLTAFSPFWNKKILCFSDILFKDITKILR